MLRNKSLTLLITAAAVLVAACMTLEAGFEKTPTHDFAAVGTIASLKVTGTYAAHLATQIAVPLTPAPTTGLVSGQICYPGEQTPPMTIYFSQPEAGLIIELAVIENQKSYQVDLSPGSYFVFAWVESYRIGGMYTQAVLCGLSDECTDHRPLLISVSAGHILQNIDICDWAHPESELPFPSGVLLPAIQAFS